LIFRGKRSCQTYRFLFATDVGFVQLNPKITAMTFSWMVWTDPAFDDYFHDAETGHGYGVLRFATATSWDDAYAACRRMGGLRNTTGDAWHMAPSVVGHVDNMIYKMATKGQDVPIAHVRDASGKFGFWSTSEHRYKETRGYVNWRYGVPQGNMNYHQCAMMSGAAFGWEDVGCSEPRFWKAVCRHDSYSREYFVSGSVVWSANANQYSYITSGIRTTQIQPFTLSTLPAGDDQIYGATIQTLKQDCRSFDKWVLGITYNAIHLYDEGPCHIMFAGGSTTIVYNSFVSSIRVRALYQYRGSIRYSYIYWRDADARGQAYDHESGYFVLPVGRSLYVTSPAAYTFYSASAMCATLSLQFAALPTVNLTAASDIAAKKANTGTLIGATRTVAGGSYTWAATSSFLSAGSEDWFPAQPLTDTNLCAQRMSDGSWSTAGCSSVFRSVLCRGTAPAGFAGLRSVVNDPPFATFKRNVRAMVFDTLNNLLTQPIDDNQLAWMNPVPATTVDAFYGLTISVAREQCTPGDVLSIRTTPMYTAAIYTMDYDATNCILKVSGWGTMPMWRTVLVNVNLQVAQKFRQSVTLTWAVWETNNVPTFVEPFSRHAYRYKTGSAQSWNNVERSCKALGFGWRMVEINSKRELDLVSAIMGAPIPIRMVRDRNTGMFGQWTDGLSRPHNDYANWAAGQPTNSATNLCVYLDVTDKKYYETDCSLISFWGYVCERDWYEWSNQVALVSSSIVFNAHPNLPGTTVINPANLPTSLTDVVYGATVQQHHDQCFDGDRFFLSQSNDDIVVVSAVRCEMKLRGTTSVEEYNHVVGAVLWQAVYPYRSNISVGYIYWTDPSLPDITFDIQTNRMYTVFPVTAMYTPSGTYNFYPASQYCTANAGWKLAEPVTESDRAESNRALADETTIFGLTRATAGGTYQWLTAGATTSLDWNLREPTPEHDPLLCTSIRRDHKWEPFSCEVYAEAVMCMNPTPTMFHVETIILSGLPVPSFNTVRNLSFVAGENSYPLFRSPQLDWVKYQVLGSDRFYGATVQEALATCDPVSDSIYLPTVLAPVSTGYYPSVCALYATGAELRGAYGSYVENARFKQAPTSMKHRRPAITFSYFFYTDIRMLSALTDHELRIVQVLVAAPNATWATANRKCTELGDGWHMTEASNFRTAAFAGALSAAAGAQVPLAYFRPTSASPFMFWSQGLPVASDQFANWKQLFPSPAATGGACAIVSLNTTWEDASCTDFNFTNVVCENQDMQYYGGATHIVLKSDMSKTPNMVVTNPFPIGLLPTQLTMWVYGATLQQSLSQCRVMDYFWLTVPDDRIQQLHSENCFMLLAGKALAADYNTLLQGVTWMGLNPYREAAHKFYWIYWTHPYIREMMMDETTNHVYSHQTSTTRTTVDPAYAFHSTSNLCSFFGMYTAELTTTLEIDNVQRLQHRQGRAWLGAKRASAGATPLWNTAGAMTVTNWAIHLPVSVPTDLCLIGDSTGGWRETKCGDYEYHAICEKDTWTYAGVSTIVTSALTLDNTELNVMTIGRNPVGWTATQQTFKAFTANSLAYLLTANGTIVYSGAVMPHLDQCNPDDMVSFTAPGASYKPATCWLHSNSQQDVAAWYWHLLSTTVSTRYRPTSVTYSWVLTTDLRVTHSYYDHESRIASVSMTNSFPVDKVSWDQAFAICTSLGLGWEMVRPTNNRMTKFLVGLTADPAGIPINIVTNSSGVFGSWIDRGYQTLGPYADWESTQPDQGFPTQQCANLQGVDDRWYDTSCNGTVFTTVACQNRRYDFVGSTTSILDHTTYDAYHVINGPIPVAVLPSAGLTNFVYGATVAGSVDTCRDQDRMLLTASDFKIALIRDYNADCTAWLAGRATIAEYNAVLLGLEFRAEYRYRTSQKFGFAYWPSEQQSRLALDLSTTHAYAVYPASHQWTPTGVAPNYAAPYVCQASGMYPVEVMSANEMWAVEQAAIPGRDAYIGTLRASTTTWKGANSGTLHTYEKWYPGFPSLNASMSQCAMRHKTSYWKDIACTMRMPSIACEVDSAANQGTYTHTLTPSSRRGFTTTRYFNLSVTTGVAAFTVYPLGSIDFNTYHWDARTTGSTNMFYGFTVQLAISSCQSGDVFTEPLTNSSIAIFENKDGYCMATGTHISATKARAGDILFQLSQVKFSSTSVVRRPSLTFSAIFWPSADAVYFYSVESQRNFAFVKTPTVAQTWDDAFDACAALGLRWRMASPLHQREALFWYKTTLLFTWSATVKRFPIAVTKDTRTGRWSNVGGEPNKYSNWMPQYPDNAGSGDVANHWFGDGSGYWTSTPHAAVPALGDGYEWGICAKDAVDDELVASITYSPVPAPKPAAQIIVSPFTASDLPTTGLTTTIYGATFQSRATECRGFDELVLGLAHDEIALMNFARCLWQFAGSATIAQYNLVFSSLVWRYDNPFRSTVTFAYVYWTQKYVTNMVIDADSGIVYSSLPIVSRWTPLASYPFDPLETACQAEGMQPVEIRNVVAAREQQRTQTYGSMAIGGVRVAGTLQWYTSGVAMEDIDWFPLEPSSNTTLGCVRKTTNGPWYATRCDSQQRSVGCMSASWPYKGVSAPLTAQATIPYDTHQTINVNQGRLYPFANNESYKWVSNTAVMYGMSVQLVVHMCRIDDNIGMWAWLPWYHSMAVDRFSCSFRVSGQNNGQGYKNMLSTVYWEPTRVYDTFRGHLLFGWMFYDQPGMQDMFIDFESRHVYALVPFGGWWGNSWEQSFDLCRSLSYDWGMAAINTYTENQIMQAFLRRGLNALPFNYARKNASQHFRIANPSRFGADEFFQWAPYEPTYNPASSRKCAKFIMQTINAQQQGLWFGADCFLDMAYTHAVCENDQFYTYGFETLLVNATQVPRKRDILNVFAAGDLPASSTTAVYGATFQTPTKDCHYQDRFFVQVGDDRIGMTYDLSCIVMLAGTADVTSYNRMLLNTMWLSVFATNPVITTQTIKFGFVYWTNPSIKNMLYNAQSGSVYVSYYPSPVYFTNTASKPYDNAQAACAMYGFKLLEVDDTSEVAEILRFPNRLDESIIGLKNDGTNFRWLSNNAVMNPAVTNWAPLAPSLNATNSEQCVAMGYPSGRWRSRTCSDPFPSTLCEATAAWSLSGSCSHVVVAYPPTTGSGTTAVRTHNFLTSGLGYTIKPFPAADIDPYNTFPTGFILGVTLQVHLAHCQPGDLWSVSLAPPLSFSAIVSICVGMVEGPTTMQTYRNLLVNSVNYFTLNKDRIVISFGWVMWDDVRIDQPLVMDFDTRHLYTWYVTPPVLGQFSWERGYDLCSVWGGDWYLATITKQDERQLITVSAASSLPLLLIADTTAKFSLPTGEKTSFLDWADMEPQNAAVNQCGYMSQPDGMRWAAAQCRAVLFKQSPCEINRWALSGVVSYMIDLALIPDAGLEKNPLFDASQLPADGTTAVYGATVQEPITSCRPGDRYAINTTSDVIFIIREQDCMLMLAGNSDLTQYNRVMRKMLWRSTSVGRSALTFSFFYWSDPAVLYMVQDLNSGKYYAGFNARLFEVPNATVNSGNPHNLMSTWCQQFDMVAAKPNSFDQVQEVKRLLGSSTGMYIGAQRITNASFQWLDGSEMTYVDWATGTRLSYPYNCIKVTAAGWIESLCHSQVQSMACEAVIAPLGAVSDSQLAVNNLTMNDVNNTIIPFVMESVDSAPDDVPAFGFTVQLNPNQCILGDRWVMGRELVGAQYQFIDSACIYAMRVVQDVAWQGYYGSKSGYAVLIGDIKPYITSMQFRSTNRFRGHLSFSYIFWITKGLEWMTLDSETGHAYGLKVQTQTWDSARTYCRGLGADWTLPSITSISEQVTFEAITKFVYVGFKVIPLTGTIPIGIHQPNNGTEAYVHATGEPLIVTNWESGYPTAAAARQCVVSRINVDPLISFKWRTQACTAATSHVICESAYYSSGGTVSMIMNPAMFGSNRTITPFSESLPNSGLAEPAYGMTALLRWQDCRHLDRFLANVTHDKLVVTSESQCQLHVSGHALLQQYRTYLAGLRFLFVNGTRTSATFGYVVWNNMYQRSVIPNVETGKFYLWVGAAAVVNTPQYFWPLTAASQCALHDMHLMELYSANEEGQVRRGQQSTFAYMGAVRTNNTATFTWANSTSPLVYENWFKHSPQPTGTTLTNGCVTKVYGGQWNNVNCNAMFPVMCEGAGDMWTHQNVTIALTPFEFTQKRNITRTIVFDPKDERARNTILPPGFEVYPDDVYAHGLSLQVAHPMCIYGDFIDIYLSNGTDKTTPNGTDVSLEFVTHICTLFVKGLKPMSFYKKVMTNFTYYSNNRQAVGVTLGWVLWWDPRVSNVFQDMVERRVYTYVDLRGAPVSWYQAQEICHQYGSEWGLGSIDRDYEYRMFAPLVKNPGMAVGVQRNLSGYFENVNRELVTYFNWDTTSPSTNAAAACVELGDVAAPNRRAYRNVDCNQARFLRVLCEADKSRYVSSGQWSFVAKNGTLSSLRTISPVKRSYLPPDSSDIAYGATLQAGANECREHDRFQTMLSHDFILVNWQLDCVLSLNGRTLVSDYNLILENTLFHMVDLTRDRIRFGVIINKDPRFEMLSMDLDNGDTYTSYVMTMPWTQNGSYPIMYTPETVCNDRGMQVATLRTEWEDRAANGAARFLDAAIGLRRVGATWKWRSDDSVASPHFVANDPASSPRDCVAKIQNSEYWIPVDCTNRRFTSVLCEAPNTTLNILSTSWAETFSTTPMPKQYPSAVRQLSFTTSNVAITPLRRNETTSRPDLFFPSANMSVFGATVQIVGGINQCDWVLDQLDVDLTKYPGLGKNKDYWSCSLFVFGSATIATYRNLLEAVTLTLGARHRPYITFGWVLWTVAGLDYMQFNPDTRTVYGSATLANDFSGGYSWYEVIGQCANFGREWKLPVVDNDMRDKYLHFYHRSYKNRERDIWGIAANTIAVDYIMNSSRRFTDSRTREQQYQNWYSSQPGSAAACTRTTSTARGTRPAATRHFTAASSANT
jgi:hypothetical protein